MWHCSVVSGRSCLGGTIVTNKVGGRIVIVEKLGHEDRVPEQAGLTIVAS